LEETTVLNARNEELAQLSAQYQRRMAMVGQHPEPKNGLPVVVVEPERKSEEKSRPLQYQLQQPSIQLTPSAPYPLTSNPSTSTLGSDETADRYNKLPKIPETEAHTPSKGRLLKWGVSKAKEIAISSGKLGSTEHNFQPMSLLRFTRCDHCGDKMWGSQLRCTGCSISVHTRCVNHVQAACNHLPTLSKQPEQHDESQNFRK